MMDHYSDQGGDGIELLDMLFDQNDGILRYEEMGNHVHHTWSNHEPDMLHQVEQQNEDFLNALLSGSDSVSGSPQWSPSPSDSGISEDPPSDQMDSPQHPDSPSAEPHFIPPQPQTKAGLGTDFSVDIKGWDSGYYPGRTEGGQCSSDVHKTLSFGLPLTVKDLLLSGTFDPYEERILKKIRRKIRNKQSAQESRKKKKEYIDGLESRMAACNAHNQELQRKVFQLEKCNTSLMEQLRRLQALVMNGSSKAAQTGTCVLVLLLSFSLILFPSLKPFSDPKVSQGGDFSPVRVQSRSLHNLQSSRVLHIIDQPYQTADDESTSQRQHFTGDQGVDEITSLLGKLGTGHSDKGLSNFNPMSHNNSLDEQSHFHGDPITGHVASVTLNSHRQGTPRPHADDM
uniref:BZIP domain-containing protein n=1 Tax=Esox lucius TaxID=8010 RepID=A0AAY5KF94_ESOLU